MNIYLKGNYKSFTKLDVYKTKKKTNKVLINVHGLYAVTGDRGSKSKFLGNRILEKNIANVVHFSSSRDWNIFPSDGTYSKQQESFKGKTFDQEAQDLSDSIDLILDQGKLLFSKSDIRLYIVASSIGGTVVSTLKSKFKYIDKLVLAGSGTGGQGSTKPILSTCPLEEEVLKVAKIYKGKLLFLQGSKDDVVPFEAQNKLLDGYKNAKKEKVIIEGANHNFSKINGKDKRLAQKLYCDFIIKFLAEK